jgi:hypothetical protein
MEPICREQQDKKRCADPGYVPSDRHNHLRHGNLERANAVIPDSPLLNVVTARIAFDELGSRNKPIPSATSVQLDCNPGDRGTEMLATAEPANRDDERPNDFEHLLPLVCLQAAWNGFVSDRLGKVLFTSLIALVNSLLDQLNGWAAERSLLFLMAVSY